MRLWIDTELYSPIDLKSVGVYRYAADPATELTLVAWAIDDNPPRAWDVTAQPRVPPELRDAFASTDEVWAHNAQFDRVVLWEKAGLEAPVARWRCTMTQAMAHGLPAGLGPLGAALGLPENLAKLKEGRELVHLFCKPHHRYGRTMPYNEPERWQRFIEYALQDVEAARECQRRMPSINYPDNRVELETYHIDQLVNDRGMPVDRTLAATAGSLARQVMDAYDAQMAALTGGAVGACSQVAALKRWLADQEVDVDSLDKAALGDLLDRDDLPEPARQALLLRQAASKTSTAKYGALVGATGSDGRLRGTLMFYGASRTGRWSGKVFQPQNLPRGGSLNSDEAVQAILEGTAEVYYPSPLDALSAAVRGAIKAPHGSKLVVSDLASIEGRVLAWLANEQWKLDAYAAGADMYVLTYAKAFGIDPEQVDNKKRQVGKVIDLSLGYQGGVGALATMAANYSLHLPEVEEQRQWVRSWREANPEIVGLWYGLQEAVERALTRPGKTQAAGRLRVKACKLGGEPYLLVKLPSGRFLAYHRPVRRWVEDRVTDPETGQEYLRKRQVIGFTEYGKGVPMAAQTYGGKLVENATQAVARDVLAWALPRVLAAGYAIIGTVHDEIITEVPDNPAFSVQRLSAALATAPPWAEGLPLGAAGFEAKRYRKE